MTSSYIYMWRYHYLHFSIVQAEDRFAKLFFDTKLGMYSPV